MVLCKKSKASPLPEHFQTTSELIYNTNSLETESSSHDDTKKADLKILNFQKVFFYQI